MEEPAGCRLLQRFDVLLGVPTWTFEVGGARLVQRIWMEPGHNVTFVRFELDQSAPRVSLSCRLLVNDRDYHSLVHRGEQAFQAQATEHEIVVHPPDSGVPIHVRCVGNGAADIGWHVDYSWCRHFHLPVEAARGLDHLEDHLAIGRCDLALKPGGAATFSIAAGAEGAMDERRRWSATLYTRGPGWRSGPRRTGLPAESSPTRLTQMVLAADQFVVARPAPEEPDGHTVIAGYPWFTDWGRDTMISLPGLTLVTGRPAVARQILRTWARHIDQGLIPNRFPDAGDQPVYNTADATLWYLWAIDQYVRHRGCRDAGRAVSGDGRYRRPVSLGDAAQYPRGRRWARRRR